MKMTRQRLIYSFTTTYAQYICIFAYVLCIQRYDFLYFLKGNVLKCQLMLIPRLVKVHLFIAGNLLFRLLLHPCIYSFGPG
jgi:hypothetical protein